MAKIESGHAEWRNSDVDLRALLTQAVQTTSEMFRERGARSTLHDARAACRRCAPTPTG